MQHRYKQRSCKEAGEQTRVQQELGELYMAAVMAEKISWCLFCRASLSLWRRTLRKEEEKTIKHTHKLACTHGNEAGMRVPHYYCIIAIIAL